MFTTVSTANKESKSGPHNLQYYKDQKRKVKMLLKKYQKGGVQHRDGYLRLLKQ